MRCTGQAWKLRGRKQSMSLACHSLGACVTSNLHFSPDCYLWALQRVCQLHRIAFSPDLILQQIPPPYGLPAFQRAAEALGLDCVISEADVSELPKLPLPCLVVTAKRPPASRPGISDQEITIDGSSHTLAILLRADVGRVLFIEEGGLSPEVESLERFASRYVGTAMLIGRDRESAVVPEEGQEVTRAFGFRWFVPELLKHKAIWRDVLIASLAIQMLALATPLFTQIVIDKVIVHHAVNTLIVIGAALVVSALFSTGINWIRQYLVLHAGNRIDSVLGSRVFEHLFRLPLRYFEHRSTGTLVARIQGVETIRNFLSSAAVTVILDVPFLLIFLTIMLYYSWQLTLVVVTLSAATAGICLMITPTLRRRVNEQFMLAARNQAFLTERVSAIETVKSLQLEPQISGTYSEYLGGYLVAGLRTKQLSNTFNATASFLEQMTSIGVLCIGAWIVMNNLGMTIGMLVAFQMFSTRLASPMLRMVSLWHEFQQADIAVRRLGDIMNAPREPCSVLPKHESLSRGKMELRDLTFRYSDELPVLYRELSLIVEPGQCIAIVGSSGTGKSTLAKLLQGFYVPTAGSVLVDDHDIRTLSANELRSCFGVVPQETVLFSGTILDNLVAANPNANFEQVVRACKLAEIHEVIDRLPEGYRTTIGERGIGLSGGQRQRIAIARALLKRPKILVFDEATNNLEAETVRELIRTINLLKGSVTVLFIAHQIPSGLLFDRTVRIGA